MSFRHTVIGTIGSGRDFQIASEETRPSMSSRPSTASSSTGR
jgi:hypothetical protein